MGKDTLAFVAGRDEKVYWVLDGRCTCRFRSSHQVSEGWSWAHCCLGEEEASVSASVLDWAEVQSEMAQVAEGQERVRDDVAAGDEAPHWEDKAVAEAAEAVAAASAGKAWRRSWAVVAGSVEAATCRWEETSLRPEAT